MNNQRAAVTFAACLVAASTATVRAASFRIQRVQDAAQVATAAPVAIVTSSPFDDAPTRLSDGTNYFYAVTDQDGHALTIAVQRNPVLGGVRVSFDDGDPASAHVAASASSVAVAPSSIRADGVQTAVALIVPRDLQGVPLGRGLTLSIDAAVLWPGHLSGAIEDLGDGSYRARIVSSIPGSGRLDVTVEGVLLAAAPSLTYTALDPNGSLRDLAILRLRDLAAPSGRITGLQDDRAQQAANAALETLANGNEAFDENVLKIDLDNVLRQLAPLADGPGGADVRDLMQDVLDVARLIAEYHLDLASGACGACAAGTPNKVCNAASELDDADGLRGAVNPDWTSVVDGYARSVEWSLQAEHGC